MVANGHEEDVEDEQHSTNSEHENDAEDPLSGKSGDESQGREEEDRSEADGDKDEESSEEEEAATVEGNRPSHPSHRGKLSRGRGRGTGVRGRIPKKIDREPAEKPSLRELNNLAYSRSSLHNHKSNSSNRHQSTSGPPQKSRGRGASSYRGGERGRGRGRGQPDMRLRMNAMLEKIKRDFA